MNAFPQLSKMTYIACACLIALSVTVIPASAQKSSTANSNWQTSKDPGDTIIITLSPGADMDKVNETLDDLHGTVRKTLHVNNGNYTILYVMPEKGKVDSTIKKILDKKDKNFKSISRNGKLKASGGKAETIAVPNDPTYSEQWNLSTIRWNRARDSFFDSLQSMATPHMIDLDSGCAAITPHNELNNITQYDALSDAQDPQLSTPGDVYGHGTACCDMYGAVTDNDYDLAGVASFSPSNTPKIYEFQVLNGQDSFYDSDVISVLTYISNNLTNLGGKSPINISLQSDNSGNSGAGPLWSNSTVATLAQTLQGQGCKCVFCAGDYGTNLSKYPIGDCRVVQGTDRMNHLGTTTGYPSSYIGENKPTAPGYDVPLYWYVPGTGLGLYNSYGTSFSSPTWAAGIAILQALKPGLSAPAADRILVQTGRTVDSKYNGHDVKVLMLDLYAAIRDVRCSN